MSLASSGNIQVAPVASGRFLLMLMPDTSTTFEEAAIDILPEEIYLAARWLRDTTLPPGASGLSFGCSARTEYPSSGHQGFSQQVESNECWGSFIAEVFSALSVLKPKVVEHTAVVIDLNRNDQNRSTLWQCDNVTATFRENRPPRVTLVVNQSA